MGNVFEGDGWRYRGRGYVQITGKTNYDKFSELIVLDLLANPDWRCVMTSRPRSQ